MTVTYTDGVRFEAETRGHRLVSDQPSGNGGQDLGMTPPELLLASLGTCAGYYAVEYLKARNLPTNGLTVSVVAEKAVQPARLGSFNIQLEIPGVDSAQHLEGVERAVRKCLIHNTLLHAPSITVRVVQLATIG